MERIIFYLLAIFIVVFALLSVTTKKLYRAAIYLLFVLLSISGIYFLLEYNFMGAVQLSVYVGGIMVILIYAIMMTDKIEGPLRTIPTTWKIVPIIVTVATAATAIYAIVTNSGIQKENVASVTTVDQVGEKLLSYDAGGFVLPFEVISVLLLAVMIGAIVIAKAKKLVDQQKNIKL